MKKMIMAVMVMAALSICAYAQTVYTATYLTDRYKQIANQEIYQATYSTTRTALSNISYLISVGSQPCFMKLNLVSDSTAASLYSINKIDLLFETTWTNGTTPTNWNYLVYDYSTNKRKSTARPDVQSLNFSLTSVKRPADAVQGLVSPQWKDGWSGISNTGLTNANVVQSWQYTPASSAVEYNTPYVMLAANKQYFIRMSNQGAAGSNFTYTATLEFRIPR